eukprot:352097-Chlamydomonas_euryale.AAC.2
MMQAMRPLQAPRAPPPPSRPGVPQPPRHSSSSRAGAVRSAGRAASQRLNPVAATSAAGAANAAASASAPTAMPADGASRRAALAAMAGACVSASLFQPSWASAGETNAGSYLPPSDVPGLVTYVPNMQKTPVSGCSAAATSAHRTSPSRNCAAPLARRAQHGHADARALNTPA